MLSIISPEDRAAFAPALASALGITAYEANVRLRVSGSGPFVIATFGERPAADEASCKLGASGLSTVMISDEEIASSQKGFPVRTFRFNSHTLHAESRQKETLAVDYQKIFLIIRGMGMKQETSTETTKERKFDLWKSCSLRRAGNIQNREDHRAEDNRRTGGGFFSSMPKGSCRSYFEKGRWIIVLSGPALQPSRTANFTALLAEIRSRSPQARFDDRLTQGGSGTAARPPRSMCRDISGLR